MTIPPFHGSIGFNAHHSPMGAYFSFTCGHPGTRGGMGLQMGRPAEQDIFVGVKEGDRYADVPLKVLPFFKGADTLDPMAAFMPEKKGEDRERLSPFRLEELRRRYGWGTDRWHAGSDGAGMEFSIYTPFGEIPEPGVGSEEEIKKALCPAVVAEVRVDNRAGKETKTGFFAINFHDGGVRLLELEGGRIGIGFRRELGFCGEVVEVGEDHRCMGKISEGCFPFIKWWPHEGLEDRSNPVHLLGTCGGMGFEVPAGKYYALRLMLACHLDGIVTSGLSGRYFYNRYFSSLEGVLNYAGPLFSTFKKAAAAARDKEMLASGLSADQQFLIAHATRSYYGNTQLLEIDGGPYWIVNEGEYRMMNTLDLAVDQLFWELERNPWVVRNVLDGFLKRYSYTDEVKLTTESQRHRGRTEEHTTTGPGGISFCHDQGTHNQFSPAGRSAYELKDLNGCFSFMTQEQLCNWVLMAASYLAKTKESRFSGRYGRALGRCSQSMDARCYSEGWLKGIMGYNSAMCGSGREITTYDSLDASLGQAAESLYLAMKCTVTLASLIDAKSLRERIVQSVRNTLRTDGFFPAVLVSDQPAFDSRILAVIEPLVFLLHFPNGVLGNENFKMFFDELRQHMVMLLADSKSRNKFADGGIRLSSSSDNSWLSKIAIVQHVARSFFNLDENGKERTANAGASGWEKADAAHVKWLTTGAGAYWCACDQIVNGEAKGSKYYPRLITCALWLREVGR